jgi:hypothetical protein
MSVGSALIQRNSLLKIGELRAHSRPNGPCTAMKEITHNPLVVLPQFRFMYFPNDIENGMSILAIMSISYWKTRYRGKGGILLLFLT